MKERLLKILDIKGLSSAQFADIIGVQRSSISHILSGRNKPSYDFLVKILDKFPDLNAEWLLTGNGKVEKLENNKVKPSSGANLFNQSKEISENTSKSTVKEPYTPLEKEPKAENNYYRQQEKHIDYSKVTNVTNVKRIILIYEDDTFEVINKR